MKLGPEKSGIYKDHAQCAVCSNKEPQDVVAVEVSAPFSEFLTSTIHICHACLARMVCIALEE